MTAPTPLHKPVAVFDSGIGSYTAVAALRRALPQQDILYFADRASFPYGGKDLPTLLAILRRSLHWLESFDPAAILVASNAPSITVLDRLQDVVPMPVLGVRPPLRAALAATNGPVAVLGVKSLVESPQMRAFAAQEAGAQAQRLRLVNASMLVEQVENGAFLAHPAAVQRAVEAFVAGLGDVTALTLSSTHLPWLRPFIERAAPGLPLFDPLDDAIAAILPLAVAGSGSTLALATETPAYPLADFQRLLDRLGAAIRVVRQPALG